MSSGPNKSVAAMSEILGHRLEHTLDGKTWVDGETNTSDDVCYRLTVNVRGTASLDGIQQAFAGKFSHLEKSNVYFRPFVVEFSL